MLLQAFDHAWQPLSCINKLLNVCHSIWTIDLAHLLRRFRIRVEFATRMLGANPAYTDERFYADHMPQDALRVHRLFQVIALLSWPTGKHAPIIQPLHVGKHQSHG